MHGEPLQRHGTFGVCVHACTRLCSRVPVCTPVRMELAGGSGQSWEGGLGRRSSLDFPMVVPFPAHSSAGPFLALGESLSSSPVPPPSPATFAATSSLRTPAPGTTTPRARPCLCLALACCGAMHPLCVLPPSFPCPALSAPSHAGLGGVSGRTSGANARVTPSPRTRFQWSCRVQGSACRQQ